eukprot:28130_1
MAFLFRRNKTKNPVSPSPTNTKARTVSTRILQINLDEVKQEMDAEKDEAKKQHKPKPKLPKKDASKSQKASNDGYPEIKFRIEVEYNAHSWTVDRALNEFVNLRQDLRKSTNHQLRPFALFPYGVSDASTDAKSKLITGPPLGTNSSHNMANAEAPFLREMRLALDRWLDGIITNPDVAQTSHLSQYLDWQKHKDWDMDNQNQEEIYNRAGAPKNCVVDDFVLLKVLGKGSFGKVLLVRKKDDRKIFAMKCLKKQRVFQRHQVEHTKTERRVLGYLDHPFLVSLHYAFQTDHKLFLVLDYAAGGELFFHLSKAGRFTEDRTRFYIAEIVLAVDYLHSKDIIYRDLKPENILLDSVGHVKITDFGLCKENVPDNVSAHSFCGTPEYLAPEILRKVGHGKAADWWTLGALIYEMLCGVPPFYSRSRDALFDKILRQKIRFPNYFSKESIDIIKQLMQRNPKYRMGARNGAKEVQVHVFFKEMNWEQLFRREIEPPFKPRLSKDKHGVIGGANFDPEFTGMPIDSPEGSKRKYAPFEDFTFDGNRAVLDEDDEFRIDEQND